MELQPILPIAATSHLSENSRLGLTAKNPALYPGFLLANSSTFLGLPQACFKTASGDTVVLNNPLAFTDPTGQGPEGAAGCLGGPVGCAVGFAAAAIFDDWLFNSIFGGPSFHGTLKPRPAGTGNPQWDGNFGESLGISTKIRMGSWGIAQALGLPDAECEFGSCGGIGSIASSFTQGAAIAAPLTWCGEHPTICTAGADLAAFVRAIPAVTASVLLLRMEGDGPATAPGVDRAACYEQYERDLDVCRKNHKRSCYAQAMERYSACLAGKSAPPFNF